MSYRTAFYTGLLGESLFLFPLADEWKKFPGSYGSGFYCRHVIDDFLPFRFIIPFFFLFLSRSFQTTHDVDSPLVIHETSNALSFY